MNIQFNHQFRLIIVTYLYFIGIAQAGTLALSDQALDLQVGVDPNVFFLMDDSGSMAFEAMTPDASEGFLVTDKQPDGSSTGTGSFDKVFNANKGYLDNSTTDNCSNTVSTAEGFWAGWHFSDAEFAYNNGYLCQIAYFDNWRYRNSSFNKLYYDPNQTYTPWPGLDQAGNAFSNITLTSMPSNPYKSSPETVTIDTNYRHWKYETTGAKWYSVAETPSATYPQGFVYYDWTDTNSNGLYDEGEQTRYSLGSATTEQRQNFANWFGYYRSRELLAKGAIAKAIEPLTNVRIAYSTINENSSGFQMEEMNPSPNSGNKKALFDVIYSTPSSGGTALRAAYDKVGKYFECVSGNTFGASTSSSTPDCPIGTSLADSCRQNYAIVITDGFYNGSFSSIGNSDADDTANAFDGGAFADTVSNTMADIAMHYYKRDLSPLQNNVSVTNFDIARSALVEGDTMHQHLATYFIGFGVEGTQNTEPSDYATAFSWPDPNTDELKKIDDLRHAAYNGRGLYLSAKNTTELQGAIADIFDSIQLGTSSNSSVALNTQSLEQGSKVFRAFYNVGDKTGDLVALDISVNGTISTQSEWSAAKQLDTIIANGTRNVISYKRDGATIGGIDFDTANMSAAQRSALEIPTPSTMPGSYGGIIADERVAYLKGATINEGSNFNNGELRDRLATEGRLGDIVHSSPVYVGKPRKSSIDSEPYPIAVGERYSDFANTASVQNRDQIIYIGANDGMLHGFNALTGNEVFAYVPGQVYENLGELTNPNYNHKMFVDLTPTIEDVYIKTTAAATDQDWATVLVGGYRAGGKGYFALNITNPNNLNNSADAISKVMWEFTNDDDADLGYSFSESFLGMSNVNAGTTSSVDSGEVDGGGAPIFTTINNKQWYVFFGNGYNSSSADGDAALYALKIDGGLDGDWTDPGDYIKISTGKGKAESFDGQTPNGISGIRAVDLDANGTVDYIYAGDYQGNLFRFDLTNSDPSLWEANTKLLFSAQTASTTVTTPTTTTTQKCTGPWWNRNCVDVTTTTTTTSTVPGTDYPFVITPFVVDHPTKPGLIVVAATGSWITDGDATDSTVQSIYGIHDDFSATPTVAKADLVEQAFTLQTNSLHGYKIRELSNNSINWNNKHGWFVDLDDAVLGERALQLQVRGGIGFAGTITPKSGTSCGDETEGYILAFNPVTGGVPDAVVFDLDGNSAFDDGDKNGSDIVAGIGLGVTFSPTKIIGNIMIIPLNDGTLKTLGVQVGSTNLDGRLSWRELQVPEGAY